MQIEICGARFCPQTDLGSVGTRPVWPMLDSNGLAA